MFKYSSVFGAKITLILCSKKIVVICPKEAYKFLKKKEEAYNSNEQHNEIFSDVIPKQLKSIVLYGN